MSQRTTSDNSTIQYYYTRFPFGLRRRTNIVTGLHHTITGISDILQEDEDFTITGNANAYIIRNEITLPTIITQQELITHNLLPRILIFFNQYNNRRRKIIIRCSINIETIHNTAPLEEFKLEGCATHPLVKNFRLHNAFTIYRSRTFFRRRIRCRTRGRIELDISYIPGYELSKLENILQADQTVILQISYN